jgi:hypothetical protein
MTSLTFAAGKAGIEDLQVSQSIMRGWYAGLARQSRCAGWAGWSIMPTKIALEKKKNAAPSTLRFLSLDLCSL